VRTDGAAQACGHDPTTLRYYPVDAAPIGDPSEGFVKLEGWFQFGPNAGTATAVASDGGGSVLLHCHSALQFRHFVIPDLL
jgi:hypothetical protein